MQVPKLVGYLLVSLPSQTKESLEMLVDLGKELGSWIDAGQIDLNDSQM